MYSFRHQSIANMKRLYEPEEVAALVGHGTDLTAYEHYGARRNGYFNKDVVTPNPSDIPKIKQLLSAKLSKRVFKSAVLDDSHG